MGSMVRVFTYVKEGSFPMHSMFAQILGPESENLNAFLFIFSAFHVHVKITVGCFSVAWFNDCVQASQAK